MKPRSRRKAITRALWLAALCFLPVLGGAAQTGSAHEAFKGSAGLREAVAEAASNIEKYADQLVRSERSLVQLSRSDGQFRDRYGSFAKNLRKLEKVQTSAVRAVEKMRTRETEYFTAWDKANMQIADPELRRAAAERRSLVMTEYQALAADLSSIGRELQPLMSHLRDVDLFLGPDPSRANLREASSLIDISRAKIRTLKSEIADVLWRLKAYLNGTFGESSQTLTGGVA